ncbi:unnamed protein product [Ostreobium quekettii]|uniref:DUF547 domain-containing protein n=1 Tax=Ostreobium quekettii TaxID=121088 RepID=A0A8S1JEZ9_9CHLO|nr:unnamed protein product [Ostreobium quekettii]
MASDAAGSGNSEPDWQPMDKYITPDGLVRYDLFLEEGPGALEHNARVAEQYAGLDGFEKRTSRDLAFYCNAYNMLAMCLAYQKLKKTEGKWKGLTGFVDKGKFFYLHSVTVAGQKMNLLNLENKIIRAYNEPRVHFAINCCSWSCPRLPQELFHADTFSEQLDSATSRFINVQGGAVVNGKAVSMSKIFKWYKGDFDTHGGGIINFINKYKKGDNVPQDASISWQDYDWSINWTKNPKAQESV